MQRVAFLVNRTIRRYDNVVGEIEYRCANDMECKFFSSSYAGHIEEMAAEAVREDFDYIIAVGGDGSVNEALNGILSKFRTGSGTGPEAYDWDAVKKVRFGIYPAGSGNDFARHMGLKSNIRHLRDLIREDSAKAVDVGWTSFTGKKGRPVERFFLNITDVGMGGTTVQHLEKYRVPMIGSNLNYMKAILSSFITYKKSKVRWTSGADSWEGRVMSMVVANGKYFGSGLGVAPDAEVDDGRFSLVTLADITILDYLKNMGAAKACRKIEHPEVNYYEVQEVLLEPAEGQQLPIDMDGEFVGYCPMTIKCVPGAISFLV
jgi:YegS/Rv2252/BmrU family lipid kinase